MYKITEEIHPLVYNKESVVTRIELLYKCMGNSKKGERFSLINILPYFILKAPYKIWILLKTLKLRIFLVFIHNKV